MGKQKQEKTDIALDEKQDVDTTEIKKAQPEKVLINIDAFISMKALQWTVKARLEHYVAVNKLEDNQTVEAWENFLKKA